jgi:capsular exopolysaccharide synthesis family protein
VNIGAFVASYGHAYRRWWWFLLLCAATAGVVAYALTGTEVRYQATTTLAVGRSLQEANPDQAELEAGHLLALTYADLALRQPVLQKAAASLGRGDDWQDLQDRVVANAVIDTPLLEITATGQSPREAQQIADEIADQLIDVQNQVVQPQGEDLHRQRFVEGQLVSLEGKIASAEARLTQIQASLANPTSPRTRAQLTAEAGLLDERIARLQEAYATLVAVAEDQAAPRQLTILSRAQADPTPERSDKRGTALIAFFLGLFFGLGVITVWERARDSVKSEDEITSELGVPLLGAVRPLEGRNAQSRLLVRVPSSHPAADDYRIIRNNIQFADQSKPVKSILITNPPGGQGKSTTVANLGTVTARAGLKTVLIDGDLRRPVLHELFDLPPNPGLAEFLSSTDMEVEQLLRSVRVENLQVITSGRRPDNPSDLLDSPRMVELVTYLTMMADLVIVDSPPLLAVADGVALAKQVDGVVLVFDSGRTKSETARHALSALEYSGARVLGVVLNRAPERATYDYVMLDRPGLDGHSGPENGQDARRASVADPDRNEPRRGPAQPE